MVDDVLRRILVQQCFQPLGQGGVAVAAGVVNGNFQVPDPDVSGGCVA
jgi:hypothetical protein